MEQFNLLDFIAKLGEAVLKNSTRSAASDNGETLPPAPPSAPPVRSDTPQKMRLSPPPRVQSDNEKAIVELIKKHDMRSKAIDERIKSQNEKN